jgi:hypothetical protein
LRLLRDISFARALVSLIEAVSGRITPEPPPLNKARFSIADLHLKILSQNLSFGKVSLNSVVLQG